MIDEVMNPIDVPNEWHRFLYRSVLLEWETSICKREKFPRFVGRKPLAGISLTKVGLLKDVEKTVNDRRFHSQVEALIFYSNGVALKDLLGLIRNCVAHGHYSCPRHGWIRFHHVYQKKLKLSGQVRFSNLKELVNAIVNSAYLNKEELS